MVEGAGAAYEAGTDSTSLCNTFPSLPLMDPETMKFEVEAGGLVTSGGLGGLTILHQVLQRVSDISKAYPDRSISGIGGDRIVEHSQVRCKSDDCNCGYAQTA